jgi:hypothetical protein
LHPRHIAKIAKERNMIMLVNKMTPQERTDWLDRGIVLSGIKPPKRLPQASPDTKLEANPQVGDQT